MKARAIAFGVLGLLSGAFACQAIIGFEEPTHQVPPDAGTPPLPVDPCAHRTVPPNTDASDNGSEVVSLGFTALRTLSIFGGAQSNVGFDLDGLCTCDDRPNVRNGLSCKPNPKQDPRALCDTADGVDNAVGAAADKYKALGIDLDRALTLSDALNRGEFSLLVGLLNYNGKADDPLVGITLVPATGIAAAPSPGDPSCADAGVVRRDGGPPDAAPIVPQWNGCDVWRVQSGLLLDDLTVRGGVVPLNRSIGYVRDGKLIAELPLPFTVSFGAFTFPLTDIRLVSDIELRDRAGKSVPFGSPDAYRFALRNGVMAGRIAVEDLVRTMGEAPGGNNSVLCNPADPGAKFAFDQVRTELCAQRDLNTAKGASPDAFCNGLSVVFPFSADPAALTRFDGEGGAPPSRCAPILREAGVDAAAYFNCPE